MIPNDTIPSVMNYANSCAALKAAPTCEQVRAGVIPLDSLPAAWWNCMWYDTNKAVNCTRYSLTSIIQEINSVLAAAGKQVDPTCVNQLYESIETVRQTIGNSICAGAVKSSSTGGEVSINANGIMTVNGVGNAALLTTSSHVVVNAINELNQVYTGCFSILNTNIDTVDNIKANNSHAVAQTSYGVGNAYDYGHLKISDAYDCCVGGVAEGLVASQKAVSDMYNYYASMTGGAKECTNQVYVHAFCCPDVGVLPNRYLAISRNTYGYMSLSTLSNIWMDTYNVLRTDSDTSILYEHSRSGCFLPTTAYYNCMCSYCWPYYTACCMYFRVSCFKPTYGENVEAAYPTSGYDPQCLLCADVVLFCRGPVACFYCNKCNFERYDLLEGAMWGEPKPSWSYCSTGRSTKRTGIGTISFWRYIPFDEPHDEYTCYHNIGWKLNNRRIQYSMLCYQCNNTCCYYDYNGFPLYLACLGRYYVCGTGSGSRYCGCSCAIDIGYFTLTNCDTYYRGSTNWHVTFNIYVNPLYGATCPEHASVFLGPHLQCFYNLENCCRYCAGRIGTTAICCCIYYNILCYPAILYSGRCTGSSDTARLCAAGYHSLMSVDNCGSWGWCRFPGLAVTSYGQHPYVAIQGVNCNVTSDNYGNKWVEGFAASLAAGCSVSSIMEGLSNNNIGPGRGTTCPSVNFCSMTVAMPPIYRFYIEE